MSRWKVAQHIHYRTWLAYPASYDSGQPHNDVDDDRPRTPRARAFRTWHEAMDYADRMARTREVVLPRPIRPCGGRPEFDFDKESGLDYNTPRTALYDGALDLEHCCDTAVLIPREHWRPLALALLALAEQEQP